MAAELKTEQEFSFKSLFIPLTTFKAIHIIVILGFLVFGNALFNGFAWDDIEFIIANPDIHSFDLSKIFGQSLFNTAIFYRVIPSFYFSLLYAFFGETAFFYHFFSIVLHIISSILVYFLFKKFFAKYLALLLTLIFLVHPIQVESVSFIAAAGNSLFLIFGISALLLSFSQTIDKQKLIFIIFLLLLSMLSKETGVLFLLCVLLYSWQYNKNNFKNLFIGSSIALGLYAIFRFGAGGTFFVNQSHIPIATLSFIERLLNIPAILFYYVKTFFFPVNLSINQQ